MYRSYCPYCLSAREAGKPCPKCGKAFSDPNQKGIHLPVGTTVLGSYGVRSYWVGAVRKDSFVSTTYGAMGLTFRQPVFLVEYSPARFGCRAEGGIQVQIFEGREKDFQDGLHRFLQEAQQMQAQSDLPSLVHILDCFQANGTAYLAMEYLDGLSLRDCCQHSNGFLPAQELLEDLKPVIRDLAALHQRGILHRGINPDNLLRLPDGAIRLMPLDDDRILPLNQLFSDPTWDPYKPLEEYRPRGQGPWTDIYHLAASIYYCITGIIPPAAVDRLPEDCLKPPAALAADLTAEQEKALLWSLELQPKARPQSMEDFATALYGQNIPPLQPAEHTDTPADRAPAKTVLPVRRCRNGHFYNADKYNCCPICGAEADPQREAAPTPVC